MALMSLPHYTTEQISYDLCNATIYNINTTKHIKQKQYSYIMENASLHTMRQQHQNAKNDLQCENIAVQNLSIQLHRKQ